MSSGLLLQTKTQFEQTNIEKEERKRSHNFGDPSIYSPLMQLELYKIYSQFKEETYQKLATLRFYSPYRKGFEKYCNGSY